MMGYGSELNGMIQCEVDIMELSMGTFILKQGEIIK